MKVLCYNCLIRYKNFKVKLFDNFLINNFFYKNWLKYQLDKFCFKNKLNRFFKD